MIKAGYIHVRLATGYALCNREDTVGIIEKCLRSAFGEQRMDVNAQRTRTKRTENRH